jgi:uncharacterized membrane protein YsdA (DUF1294 family)
MQVNAMPYLVSSIILYLIIINAVGFLLMLMDKRAARKSAWRIPEARLMNIALSGGCFGIYAGMILLRHKTKHPKFRIGVPLLMAFYILLAVGMIILTIKRRVI